MTWQGFGASAFTKTGCDDTPITTDGTFTRSCAVTTTSAPIFSSPSVSETVKRDATAPVTTAAVTPASPDLANGWYGSAPSVTLSPSDATSGLATTSYTVDGGATQAYTGAFSLTGEGTHVVSYWSTDMAGNQETAHTLTIKIDLNAPVTTAVLSPAIHNGWYASPTLTLTGNDGAGSGIDHITYSLDGGPFTSYTAPISGFSTGNRFVQYRATDVAGRVEDLKLIAFKVDAVTPSVTITRPAVGGDYKLGQIVKANFKCADARGGSGLDTCVGTVPFGSPIDTSTVGNHTFTVTATDRAGNTRTLTRSYHVHYAWAGFFAPVTNTGSSKLNLVHAGDLIRLGFGLHGNRGLGVFESDYPTSVPISCPSWPVHSVHAAPSGASTGLSFSAVSGHYVYGWQTSNTWAGTCRRFELRLNDGTSTVHSADFMFFS
jgi:hypothetical protein